MIDLLSIDSLIGAVASIALIFAMINKALIEVKA